MFKKSVAASFVLSVLMAMAFGAAESPKPISFVRPDHPFMLVSPEELAIAKAKIETQPWAADGLKALRAKADEIVASPQYFPSQKAAGRINMFRRRPQEN